MAPRPRPPVERVTERLVPEGECLVFTGKRNSKGYGRVLDETGKDVYAHRVVYLAHHGPLSEGHVVRHKCDNPPCCRLDHLESGTRAQNNGDAAERGRMPRGEAHHAWRWGADHPLARLTAEQVLEIRRRYVPRKGVGALADEFGITRAHLHAIVSRRTWKHV